MVVIIFIFKASYSLSSRVLTMRKVEEQGSDNLLRVSSVGEK